MSKGIMSIYAGECRGCGRDIRHQQPSPGESDFGTGQMVRVRCKECRKTNALEKETSA